MMYIATKKERCVILATYIVENRATVRSAAKRYGISKSTVHKDVTDTLRHVHPVLYEEVKQVLDQNKRERHLRGGEATRRKYRAKAEKRQGNATGETGDSNRELPSEKPESPSLPPDSPGGL